jgi:monofunctional biosynthetic peptidoglycan transglycosylase
MPIGRISAALQSAVVSAEDANFYEHHGVDFREMRESLKKNQRKGKYARGFSTIPMQLAKNLYLTPRKVLARKALEIAVAFEMELVLAKERILELYLNLVEWGPGIYGAEAASRHYFKKPAEALNAREAAFLAAILPNPRRWGRWPPGPYVRKRMDVLQARAGLGGARNGKRRSAEPLPELPEEPTNGENGGDPLPERGEPIPQDL